MPEYHVAYEYEKLLCLHLICYIFQLKGSRCVALMTDTIYGWFSCKFGILPIH